MGQVLAKVTQVIATLCSSTKAGNDCTSRATENCVGEARERIQDSDISSIIEETQDHETEPLIPKSDHHASNNSSTNEIVEEKELVISIFGSPPTGSAAVTKETEKNPSKSKKKTSGALELVSDVAVQEEVVREIYADIISKSKGSDHQIKNKSVTKAKKKERKWKRHYCSSHKTLLVGEGDFSFSTCLAKAFGSATNMVATSLDTLDFLKKNYANAISNITRLEDKGCIVLHDVDATQMANHPRLNGLKFDRIVYNFPLAGFSSEGKKKQLKRNRNLVRMFMKNAKEMIKADGEIHITHKTSVSYREWDLENMAKQGGLRLIEDVDFKLSHYQGYNTKYGFGGDENFNCYPSKTYKFGLNLGDCD